MATERKPNEVRMVAWFMGTKNVIKFANDDASYPLAEAVIKASNFEKFPLSKGDRVEVGIKDNVVTFLRKQKSEGKGSEEAYEPTPEEQTAPAPKVEAQKPEVPKAEAPVSQLRELTVYAVSGDKRVVKFLEIKDEGWMDVAEEIKALDYKEIGLVSKSKIRVQIADKKVVAYEKVAVEAPQSTPEASGEAKTTSTTASTPAPAAKKEWKPYNAQESDARQKSIEAQAAVNSASNVAARIGAALPQAPTANVVNAMIRAIAEANFALIQELKAK